MHPLNPDILKSLQNARPDESGVTHDTILYSEKENEIDCLLNVPDAAAIDRHHAKAGIRCDWIHEVKSTRG